MQDGAFDEAVKGVDAIEHIASPCHFHADDPAELLEPAIRGTVGILESARKYGTAVKRVVVTSSCAAVMTVSDQPQFLSEVEEKGRAASAEAKYNTSKILAERAAWDFVAKHGDADATDTGVDTPVTTTNTFSNEFSLSTEPE
ncbi:hypothetical protein GGX14DRAFT_409254 [Mycena pura]|uniref:NAD-dependent epimerase/dehydratase domain-containing protein n=1 Tax=Mycena pura TaxID=153505 RepID=A0AAD6URE6_9AGAR|nr:hypothetical protein GGX14DRAFT_409254 [Mycena pura]